MSEFEANLVYRESARTARATQRNPISKNKQKNLKRMFLVVLPQVQTLGTSIWQSVKGDSQEILQETHLREGLEWRNSQRDLASEMNHT